MIKYKVSPNFFINTLFVLTTLLLVIIVISSFQFTKDIVFHKGSQQIRNIPIYVQPYKTSLLKDRSPGSLSRYNFPQDEINISKGFMKIKYNYQNNTYKFIHVTYQISQYLLAFGLILMIRRILGSVAIKTPFSYYNVRNLNTISVISIISFFTMLIYTVYIHWHIKNYLPLDNGNYISKIFTWAEPTRFSVRSNEVLLGNFQSSSFLIFALFVFAITQVFKEGLRLKQDNESIS